MEDWSAKQYTKFEDERTRAARDLLAQVPLTNIRHAVDIGCGPANSTELVAARFPAAAITGMDSSDDMLKAARVRMPDAIFVYGEIETWSPEKPADLFFANAVLQWVPAHDAVMTRLMRELAPGGVLAVQMPDNRMEPSHVLMDEAAKAGPWREAYRDKEPGRGHLPTPAHYYDLLLPYAAHINIWHTIYYHQLADAAAIVEWVKGTGLRPYIDPLNDEERKGFLAEYLKRIEKAYAPCADGKVLLRFPRLFIVATRKD
ncbi:MAG: trans-aconitate 2-methyltransferase [Parvibaculaceae bacterium]